MRALGMRKKVPKRPRGEVVSAEDTTWIRARRGGVVRLEVGLGQRVRQKQRLATVSGTFGEETSILLAPNDGMVIGFAQNPLVNRGDGVVHLTRGPLVPAEPPSK